MRTLVWFRGKDLRVTDHGPLREAVAAGEVIPLFVLDPFFFAPERSARLPHRMQYLLGALKQLQASLEALGSRLVLAEGRSVEVVARLASEWRVDRVVAHRWVEPFGRERDRRVAEALGRDAIRFDLFEGETLFPPGAIRTRQGGPFRVFTPFSRACLDQPEPARPFVAPRSLPPLPLDLSFPKHGIPTLSELGLTANPRLPNAGETAAHTRLAHFLRGPLDRFGVDRDRMDLEGTSRLSVDLKFGTLSVRTLWDAVRPVGASAQRFRTELLWREFSHHLLWEEPDLLQRPFRRAFEGFPWREDARAWDAWREGRTGIPLVDAASRQLRAEGFVHNRARMVAASFLTKHLMLDYRQGEGHYLTWLVDGDWAQNNAGWQWCAGCGCDAQPWFRIFNPVSQGRRFDPDGAYLRRWVPELAACPAEHLQEPWRAPAAVRRRLDYPDPIVDLGFGRSRFLEVAKAHLAGATPC